MSADIEQQVISQLKGYKRLAGRIRILERTSIGYGMYLEALNGDDKLQALHRKLRGMPSYMYLNKRDQELETTAHAYLTKYPPGTRAQLDAVPRKGWDAEDDALLQELRAKIRKVIDVRGGRIDDYDAVIERMSELDELKQEKEQIDLTLETLGEHKQHYCRLLRLRYIEDVEELEVIKQLQIARRTFFRWRERAIEEYAKLAGIT